MTDATMNDFNYTLTNPNPHKAVFNTSEAVSGGSIDNNLLGAYNITYTPFSNTQPTSPNNSNKKACSNYPEGSMPYSVCMLNNYGMSWGKGREPKVNYLILTGDNMWR